jgi:hypothetical protein
MTDPKRLRALLARATHPATPPEEARTAAMIACKLLAESPTPAAGDVEAEGRRRRRSSSDAAPVGGFVPAHWRDSKHSYLRGYVCICALCHESLFVTTLYHRAFVKPAYVVGGDISAVHEGCFVEAFGIDSWRTHNERA